MHAPPIRDQRTVAVGLESIRNALFPRKDHLQPLIHSEFVRPLAEAPRNQNLAIANGCEEGGAPMGMLAIVFAGRISLAMIMARFLAPLECDVSSIVHTGDQIELGFPEMAANGLAIVSGKSDLLHVALLN
jgi:hypothetical protein